MTKTKNKITDVMSIIVEALTPLDSVERQRVIQAALTLLGDSFIPPRETLGESTRGNAGGRAGGNGSSSGNEEQIDGISNQARIWIKKNSISKEQLDEVFHIADGAVTVIASEIPGKKSGQKCVNAYVLQGISTFLLSGESSFDDKSARALCERAGFYDFTNHAKYVATKGNLFTGSKQAGWKMTNPGLKQGADLIKQLTNTSE